MSNEDPSEHDEVVSSLLDLQRRLRGGRGADTPPAPAPVRTIEQPAAPPMPAETVEVSEAGVGVRMTPERAAPRRPISGDGEPPTTAGADRVAALAQRLRHLEDDLSGVLGSIESMTGAVSESISADVTAKMGAMQREVDARTSRIVSDRVSAVSERLASELDAQRRDLAGLIERRLGSMEATLRDAIRDAADADADADPQP